MRVLVGMLRIEPPTTPKSRLQDLLARMNRYDQPRTATMLVGFLIAVGTASMVGMFLL
ncbi:MAG: hypothetical protein ABI867_14800 [Kofleriaceae bacterium]